jgi:hypothetical protein
VHTLLFYEPGHFHAALTLRSHNPRVAADVHVYAHPGPDREGFLDYLDAGRWPQWLTQGIRMRYELLARSRELALR